MCAKCNQNANKSEIGKLTVIRILVLRFSFKHIQLRSSQKYHCHLKNVRMTLLFKWHPENRKLSKCEKDKLKEKLVRDFHYKFSRINSILFTHISACSKKVVPKW